jgi:fructose-1,6-bisphosphatase I
LVTRDSQIEKKKKKKSFLQSFLVVDKRYLISSLFFSLFFSLSLSLSVLIFLPRQTERQNAMTTTTTTMTMASSSLSSSSLSSSSSKMMMKKMMMMMKKRGCSTTRTKKRFYSSASQEQQTTNSSAEKMLSIWLTRQAQLGNLDDDLVIVINSIAIACKQIMSLVKAAPLQGNIGLAGGKNESGDEQKKLDVIANDIFLNAVQKCGRSSVIVTEEEDHPVLSATNVGNGDYVVTFDPIDGSSNIDACVTTGAIFGIYSPGECDIDPTQSAEEIMKNCTENANQSGENLVAAGYCMFSSSCVFMITTGHGVFGFTLDEQIGEFVMSHEKLQIPDGKDMKRIYSGNNGNVQLWAPELREYVKQLQTGEIDGRKGDPWSYRYIGALIGDFHRTLLYGGIWLYPPDVKATEGKARLLYEVAPIAMIAEQANGMATRGKMADERVMEVKPMSIHQKSPMFVGSNSAVLGLQKFLKEH